MKKRKIIKTIMIILSGIIITGICTFLLIMHLMGLINVDAQAIVLLLIILAPWVSVFINSASLPGGWKIEFRKLQDEQERQSEIIDDIFFLFTTYVTEYEANILKGLNLGPGKKFSYKPVETFIIELERLLKLRFIDRQPGKGLRTAKRETNEAENDLKSHFYITERGIEYLKRYEQLKKGKEI